MLQETDVVDWYDLETASGSTAVTEKTGGVNGSIVGATWVTGGPTNISNGLNFTPSGQYVEVANDYDLSAGTMFVWCIIDNFLAEGNNDFIFDFGAGGGEGTIATLSAGTVFSRTRFGGDTTVTASGLSVGTTYLFVHTWDQADNGGNGQVELFLNGVSQGTANGSGTIVDQNHNLVAGRRAGLNDRYFDGKIFQMGLLNRRITSTEVAEIFNSGDGITYSALFGSSPTAQPFSQAVIIA